MDKVIYPGTFDPITRGHEDLVRRASRLFDQVIVAIAVSSSKRPFFTLDERVEMAHEVLSDCPNVKIMAFSGLLRTIYVYFSNHCAGDCIIGRQCGCICTPAGGKKTTRKNNKIVLRKLNGINHY